MRGLPGRDAGRPVLDPALTASDPRALGPASSERRAESRPGSKLPGLGCRSARLRGSPSL